MISRPAVGFPSTAELDVWSHRTMLSTYMYDLVVHLGIRSTGVSNRGQTIGAFAERQTVQRVCPVDFFGCMGYVFPLKIPLFTPSPNWNHTFENELTPDERTDELTRSMSQWKFGYTAHSSSSSSSFYHPLRIACYLYLLHINRRARSAHYRSIPIVRHLPSVRRPACLPRRNVHVGRR